MNSFWIDLIGYGAGLLVIMVPIPQIIHMIRTKRAKDLSYGIIIILLLTSILYAIYGFLINSWPLIITDTVSGVLVILMLVLKLYYDKFYIEHDTQIEESV